MIFSAHGLSRCLISNHVNLRSAFLAWKTTFPNMHLADRDVSDDEFSKYDFAEFTEDDLSRFDGLAASSSIAVDPILKSSLPAVAIGVKQENVSASANTPQQPEERGHAQTAASPFKRFRRNGIISVTDLVSPAWYVTCPLRWCH